MTSAADAPDGTVDRLLEELRAKVEQRRAEGTLDDALESSLDAHFEQLMGNLPPVAGPAVYEELDRAIDALATYEFTPASIEVDSRIPGGRAAHRSVGRVIGRQIDGVLQQSQAHARLVTHTVDLLAKLTSSIGRDLDGPVLEQIDALQVRVAEQQRALRSLEVAVADLAARVPGVPVEPWYSADRFTAIFRGGTDDVRARYHGLASELVGCSPVLEIGFGRGEFLDLLHELGVEARGVEPSADLVRDARARGYEVEVGDAIGTLERLDAAGVGGIVMIQVIEHLAPQHVIDFVALCADKVRPGGKVVVETVNPRSLYTYAHAFWVDPDHVRPVHPDYLEFLFGEAGFTDLRREFRSPVASEEQLAPVPGDDEATKVINANFERINELLFGPQDYAFIATR